MKKMRRNNKGVSLVELIIAIAILSIVGIAICGFMAFGSKNFATSTKNVKLQYEQQVTVNRIRDIILETSRGISFDEATNKLLVFGDNPEATSDSDKCSVSELILDASSNELKIKEGVKMPDSTKVSAIDLGPTSVLSDSISAFKVDLTEVDSGKVTVNITFIADEDRTIDVSTVVALRNMISKLDADSEEEIGTVYEEEVTEFYSHVASVIISRDGHKFSQGKTDTIAMAGNSTTASYQAEVIKKKSYDKNIDTSVTWSLDITMLKEGYDKCISIGADGRVTLKNVTNAGGVVTDKPSDYINGNYFVIIATSNEDPRVMAKLRIKVTDNGVYPVSITSTYDSIKDIYSGTLKYKLAHEITYTAKIKDPKTGTMVNPLTGEGVYSKVSYSVKGATAEDVIPRGSGFTSTDAVNGEFIVTKPMEGHTYIITVTVNQNDVDGNLVTDEITLTIPEGAVPPKTEVTIPQIGGSDEAMRGMANSLYGQWSMGAPKYSGKGSFGNDVKDMACIYYLEWTLSYDNNECGNWGSGERDDFSKLVYLCDKDGNKLGDGRTYLSSQINRDVRVYVEPHTDWSKNFTYRVDLRMKIYNPNTSSYQQPDIEKWKSSAKYYKLPEDGSNDFNKITGSEAEAYVATKIVKLGKVEVDLTPSTVVFKDQQNQSGKDIDSVFSTSMTVGLGKRKVNWEGDPATYYYKVFTPEFKGLSVTTLNYERNLGLALNYTPTNLKNPALTRADGTSAGYLFYGNNEYDKELFTTDWRGRVGKGFEAAFKFNNSIDNKLYLYLKLHPRDWMSTQKLPHSFTWICRICDGKGNFVTAKFTDTNLDTREYLIVNRYYNQ